MKHLFIINPAAGGKIIRFEDTLRDVRAFADSLDQPHEVYVTKAPMDACCKIAAEAEMADELRVYSCGGDGTLNECANGAANRANVALTKYPCGTGNDFLKTFGLENVKRFSDLRALVEGTVHPLDLIDCSGRYCINICSVGIDARVGRDVHKYSGIPIIGGATGYVVALVVNVIRGVTQKFYIKTEFGVLDSEITLACACNGRFYGGGFNPVPDAIPNDGEIDFLIVNPVSRLKMIQVVGKYAKGMYREYPEYITHVRGSYMEIKCDSEFVVNIDGEAVYAEDICFKVVPNGINFIFPAGMDWPETNPSASNS